MNESCLGENGIRMIIVLNHKKLFERVSTRSDACLTPPAEEAPNISKCHAISRISSTAMAILEPSPHRSLYL